jgi:hypothetical protein
MHAGKPGALVIAAGDREVREELFCRSCQSRRVLAELPVSMAHVEPAPGRLY